MADTHAAANNFLNALERIPGIIDQYREKNGILEKKFPGYRKSPVRNGRRRTN